MQLFCIFHQKIASDSVLIAYLTTPTTREALPQLYPTYSEPPRSIIYNQVDAWNKQTHLSLLPLYKFGNFSAMAPLTISPPLLNSANPWCTTLSQLQELYASPHTGAITTRTSLLDDHGFPHDPTIHQFAFYNPNNLTASAPNQDQAGDSSTTGSLNTLGYSPLPLSTYLSYIQTLNAEFCSAPVPQHGRKTHKPIILSVTGTAEEVVSCYHLISTTQAKVRMPLAMELNLSCPNIPGKPPPAYSRPALSAYLVALKEEVRRQRGEARSKGKEYVAVPIGIKTPPYTYQDQFESLVDALMDSVSGARDARQEEKEEGEGE